MWQYGPPFDHTIYFGFLGGVRQGKLPDECLGQKLKPVLLAHEPFLRPEGQSLTKTMRRCLGDFFWVSKQAHSGRCLDAGGASVITSDAVPPSEYGYGIICLQQTSNRCW